MAEANISNKEDMRRRWAQMEANFGIEGITFTAEERATFEHMIEQGMDEEQSARHIADYLANKVSVSAVEPAE